MAPRGRPRTRGITPIEKILPVNSPDELHEKATLEDYEKIAAQMAISSDKIIDEALDKMEQRDKKANCESATDVPQAKSHDKPTKVVPNTKPAPVSMKAVVPDNPTIPAPNLDIERLERENAMLIAELNRLKEEMSGFSVVNTEDMFRSEINALTVKNDDLILKNSELEFEISRLGTENNILKQKLESLETSMRTQPQIHTPNGYTCHTHGVNRTPKRTMNGYETWN